MTDLNKDFLTPSELQDVGFGFLGKEVLIHPTCVVVGASNISIGDYSRIDPFTCLVAASGELTIGRHVHIASNVFLSASQGITLGDFSGLSHGVKVLTTSDKMGGENLTNPTVPAHMTNADGGPVMVGRHVIVGAGSIVLPGVTIGLGSIVGSLSLVKESLDDWGIYAGVPAKFRSRRSQTLLADEHVLEQLEASR